METSANEISYKPMPSSPPSGFKNIVLVGRTGNGKSATGNSIVRKKAFKSMFSSNNVTRTCEKHSTQLEDGQILNVIDTPGLFDHSADPEFIRNEMLKCIDMAKDGIHAILLIISTQTPFSREEEAGVLTLKHFFGPKIMDYMIIVFTGGDEFEEHHETLDDYLCGANCPDLLKETLKVCGNICVLFNNKLKVEVHNSEQLKQLQALLNMIADNNGGRSYRGKLYTEISESEKELSDSYESRGTLDLPARESETNNHGILFKVGSFLNQLWKKLLNTLQKLWHYFVFVQTKDKNNKFQSEIDDANRKKDPYYK